MKLINLLSYIIILSTTTIFGQVGINAKYPESDLHVKSTTSAIPVVNISTPTKKTPVVVVTDDSTIGINTLNDKSAMIMVNGEQPGDAGIFFNNHSHLSPVNFDEDLAVTNEGIVVSRGNNIGKVAYVFKKTDSAEFNSNTIITDTELSLQLPKGKYLITGILKYYSGTNNDIDVKLVTVNNAFRTSGYFNVVGHYGTFTNSKNAVPYYSQPINSVEYVSVGGAGTGLENQLGAFINGIITLDGDTTISLQYKQQAGATAIARDTKVFAGSYLKILKIQ
jgi:hypothetical protein